MQMAYGPMTPRYLQETILNLCIIIGAIVGTIGLVLWAISGFSKWDALLVAALGAAIFFGFRYVKSLQKAYGEEDPEKENGGAP